MIFTSPYLGFVVSETFPDNSAYKRELVQDFFCELINVITFVRNTDELLPF